MELNGGGYLRPVWKGAIDSSDEHQVAEFAGACPGRRVVGRDSDAAVRHPYLGPVVAAWEAWATDPEIRYTASSGGALTALIAWLIESGDFRTSTAASAAVDPRRTVSVTITSREEALAASGSRYAPVSTASCCDLDAGADTGIVGKPCEVSAIRQLHELRGKDSRPILFSFFCAGTPSQLATEGLLKDLGFDENARLVALRYRGHGWPGDFYAEDKNGNKAGAGYNDSWGRCLGPTTQWRCKICPDGVGESADIAAGDFWEADESGFPDFGDKQGVSVLIARTARGEAIVRRAIAANIIEVRPANLDDVAQIQPLQRKRRETLVGRMIGSSIARNRVPRYSGFGIFNAARTSPMSTLRAIPGTFIRARKMRRSER
ncbi:Coenzyme F420 hydrogenase/dehydrogenase, beta subunit C-terminal domain [Rhodococcus sp. NPDC057529]|uniref:Coenzyme F420 hydrogenase/dehydrogenase, beta subunit C-terminal domain n=1 Tax=Rhodococcus sp. NPDC057529 TaxID=3346158 RepID=UPI00366CE53A